MSRIIAPLVAGLLAVAAPAAALDYTLLGAFGDWKVFHEYYPDTENEACAARSTNGSSHSLDLTVYPTGNMTLFVFIDGARPTANRVTDLRIDVGYTTWTLYDAEVSGDTVVFRFADKREASKFVQDLKDSTAVTLYDRMGSPYITWSLKGSSAAFEKASECVRMLSSSRL